MPCILILAAITFIFQFSGATNTNGAANTNELQHDKPDLRFSFYHLTTTRTGNRTGDEIFKYLTRRDSGRQQFLSRTNRSICKNNNDNYLKTVTNITKTREYFNQNLLNILASNI